MALLTRCPICKRPAQPRPGNLAHPFCSDRCRLIDLSRWLGEEYRIAGPRAGDPAEEERPPPPDVEEDA